MVIPSAAPPPAAVSDLAPEQLRAFVAVIEAGSFEAAARRLALTQPAVSHRIKALEVAVGRTLLVRSRPTRPTASGFLVLRLARQTLLLQDDLRRALGEDGGRASVSIVVNADSLSAWALTPLVAVATHHGISLDIHREDEQHATELLRNGPAMGIVTAATAPIAGCTTRRLGAMRYRAACSPAFAQRWFAGERATPSELARAPMICFDRKDDMQDAFLRHRSRRWLDPPRHYVPATTELVDAIRLGLGWGMVHDPDALPLLERGELTLLEPGHHHDVPLSWQQWRLRSPSLELIADALVDAARDALVQPPRG